MPEAQRAATTERQPDATTQIRRDPPESRWLAELTLPDGTTIRRRAHSKEAAELAVREAAQWAPMRSS